MNPSLKIRHALYVLKDANRPRELNSNLFQIEPVDSYHSALPSGSPFSDFTVYNSTISSRDIATALSAACKASGSLANETNY